MLSSDAQWYINNLDKIAAFQNWIELAKLEIPKQVTDIVQSAAVDAVDSINEGSTGLVWRRWKDRKTGATKCTGFFLTHITTRLRGERW